MAHFKISVVEVRVEENCLAHALVIAIAKVDKDPNFKGCIQGRKILHVDETLLETTGIDLSNGAGIPELVRFQEHFRKYKIFVYRGLSCDNIIFEGQVDSTKRLNILYDDVKRHYHVRTNLTGAMAKQFVCEGATNLVQVRSRTPATRRVVTAWPVPRVHSRALESPVRNAIDTFEVTHISRTSSSAPRRKDQYVNESCAVRRADGS